MNSSECVYFGKKNILDFNKQPLIQPNKILFTLSIFKKIKFSIDKSILSCTFTAQTITMKFNNAYFYGYYFYFTSKSRD